MLKWKYAKWDDGVELYQVGFEGGKALLVEASVESVQQSVVG